MALGPRREWRRALPADVKAERTGACVGLKLRRPAEADALALGAMLLDGYRGTPDDEGEDDARAVEEIHGFFAAKHGRPLVDASVVAWRGDLPVAGSFIGWWDARACPFVVFVVTRADQKRAGVGRLVLSESLRRLGRAGHREMRAVITAGNTPSERLFAALGFEDLGPLPPKS